MERVLADDPAVSGATDRSDVVFWARCDRVINDTVLPFGWRIRRGLLDGIRPFVQVVADDGVCNKTGEPMKWYGRKWVLSEHMTDGEIVQTCLLATLTAAEHEAREGFRYKGVMVSNPHFDIDKLVEFASGDVEKLRNGAAA